MSMQNGFTQNADLYRTSKAHSETEDLEIALEHLPNLGGLTVLDVATGSGHTAFFFARKQAHVFAVDINEEMLRVAQEESDRQSLSIRFLRSPAEELNFDDETFELVTCRLATHHFSGLDQFLQECHRVLKPGGHLLIVDNIVPEQPEAAQWINTFERERDTTHGECLTVEEWKKRLEASSFQMVKDERYRKKLLYRPWMERMSHSQETQDAKWAELLAAPPEVSKFLKPRESESGERTLRLHRQILLARK